MHSNVPSFEKKITREFHSFDEIVIKCDSKYSLWPGCDVEVKVNKELDSRVATRLYTFKKQIQALLCIFFIVIWINYLDNFNELYIGFKRILNINQGIS